MQVVDAAVEPLVCVEGRGQHAAAPKVHASHVALRLEIAALKYAGLRLQPGACVPDL
jgi:hypothetical protein